MKNYDARLSNWVKRTAFSHWGFIFSFAMLQVMYFLLFLGSFLLLFFVSKQVTTMLGEIFMRFTKSTTLTIHLLAILFFPGVMIHELGHFFMANILFVRTGDIEFLPKVLEGGVKLGSVAIEKTDPLRKFLIGVAPVLAGIGILFIASYYLQPLYPLSIKTLAFVYILFVIGNTMFSSKQDLQGTVGFLLFLAFIVLCLFAIGLRVPTSLPSVLFWLSSQPLFLQMSIWLLGSVGVNVILLGIFHMLLKTKRRYY